MKPRLLLSVLVLCLGVGIIAARAVITDRATVALTRSATPPDTLTGIPEPRFFATSDAYAWLSNARALLLSDTWRLRRTSIDNAPDGRPMHWSHLLLWELAAHARLAQALAPASTPLPLSRAIELAGRTAMPLFAILFLVPAYCLLHRKFGFLPAAATLLAAVSFPFLVESQSTLAPDHHLLQQIFLATLLAALTFGGWGRIASDSFHSSAASWWIRPLLPPSFPSARRWFLFAGAVHAALLWVGASVWLMLHVVVCLAALAALAPPDADTRPAPRLWLAFLATSLPLSIAFYLLEYAPHFPGMRLEVNHPLYWLFLLGSVLFLARLSSWRDLTSSVSIRRLLLPVLLALPLPIALLWGPASWHALRDPALARLHADFIDEFRTLVPGLATLRTFRLFLVPLVLAPIFAFRPHASPAVRGLRPLAVAALLLAALYAFQLRWGLLFAVTLPLLAAASAALLAASPVRRTRLVAFAFLAALAVDASLTLARETDFLLHWNAPDRCPADWLRADTLKRSALRLALAFQGDDTASVAGLPHDAPALHYFAGIPSLASFYWENADGWHDEAALFADRTPDASTARAIVAHRRLSCLLQPATPSRLPDLYAALAGHPAPSLDDLSVRLLRSQKGPSLPPSWLSPNTPLSMSLSATNYYHPASNTYIAFSLPTLAFSPRPFAPSSSGDGLPPPTSSESAGSTNRPGIQSVGCLPDPRNPDPRQGI